MRTKLQLYTVPGQVYYNSTRQLVLKGADGIVFVADSQDFALDANLESLQNLEDNLKRQGIRIREIPLVIQYNKRDLPNALPVAEIDKELNKLNAPKFESVATMGLGVEETLKGITQLVLAHLVKKYGLEGSEPLGGDIQILNANTGGERLASDSLWDEEDEPATPTPSKPAGKPAPPTPPPHPRTIRHRRERERRRPSARGHRVDRRREAGGPFSDDNIARARPAGGDPAAGAVQRDHRLLQHPGHAACGAHGGSDDVHRDGPPRGDPQQPPRPRRAGQDAQRAVRCLSPNRGRASRHRRSGEGSDGAAEPIA